MQRAWRVVLGVVNMSYRAKSFMLLILPFHDPVLVFFRCLSPSVSSEVYETIKFTSYGKVELGSRVWS
jgi:hypothetical protein